MITKIFRALCSAAFTALLCVCCGIAIETSLAVIVATLGCTLITDSVITRVTKKEMPTVIDWIEYGLSLALTILLTLALNLKNFPLLITSGVVGLILFGVLIYEGKLKKSKEKVVNL